MAGQTSPLAFPYPTGTDRVADGDNAIQALAEKIDDYMAGSQVGVPIDTNCSHTGQGTGVHRRGGLGTFHIELIVNIAWNIAWPLAMIPVGYRPSPTLGRVVFLVDDGGISGVRTWRLQVTDLGNVYPLDPGLSPGIVLLGSVTYPIAYP